MIKKGLFTIALCLLAHNALAADYFIKSLGNDNNTGLSDGQAWATIAKVNSSLPASSTGNFNRGDVWREQLIARSGTASTSTTYTAYGTGAKPLFLGSIEENEAGDWTDTGGNIWSNNDAEFDREVGNLIFNSEASVGTNVALEASLNVQGEFWYDATNDLIKIYSVGNPATFYSDIECAVYAEDATDYFVNVQSRNYVIVENIDVRYFSSVGVGGAFTSNINVKDCDISYGGGDFNSGRTLRKGNAIQWWADADGNTVERCKIDNIYDAGITQQGNVAGSTQNNLIYRNNKISNCEYSFEQWFRDSTSVTSNISFENNTCKTAGSGWGHNQRPDAANGRHLMFFSNTSTTSNFNIRNNVFDESTESSIRWQKDADVSDYTLDYNSFFESAGDSVVITDGSTYSFAQFGDYQTDTGQDANSITADPLLGSNLTLNASSPCIGAGVVTTNVTGGFREGSQRTDPYDIGAFVYDSVLRDCVFKDAVLD